MFLNYGNYSIDFPNGNMDKSVDLLINSCGMYILGSEDEMTTFRPQGRADYQLIYIHSGKGVFSFTGEACREGSAENLDKTCREGVADFTVGAGNIVLYRPYEAQKYIYSGKDMPEIYWVHFTGRDIDAMLESYGIGADMRTVYIGASSQYVNLFNRIISELQSKSPFFGDECVLLFKHLLIMMMRNTGNPAKKSAYNNEITNAINYFHENYGSPVCIDEYIERLGIGRNIFFAKFKNVTGHTPLQYLLEIRISTAKTLLESTEYPIGDISRIVGYDNPLYFSRLFRNHTGLSPMQYKRMSSFNRPAHLG